MLIDWFTVGAQVVNFIILVWLMKRYLYQPILRAIDAREQQIADQIAGATTQRLEAERAKNDLLRKNEQFDQQREALLQKAMDDAGTVHHRLIEEARDAARALSEQHLTTLENESRNLNVAIIHRVEQEVFAIARKALMELAAANLEERVSAVFVQRLRELDGTAQLQITETFQRQRTPALVHSAFELSDAQRESISSAIHETFSTKLPVAFETLPNIICGIELLADGHKVAWSIADYLNSLERGVAELIHQHAEPQRPESTPIHEQHA
jgi:F-type H+-transporting ATPase subunit b